MLPKMSEYTKSFDENKYMSFLVKDDELLKKDNKMGLQSAKILKRFDSEPVYNEKYLKIRIKSCKSKINTNYHNNGIPKEGSHFICLLVILIGAVLKIDQNYYLQQKNYFF